MKIDLFQICVYFRFLVMPDGTPWHRATLLANNKFFLVDSGITISSPVALKELPPSIKDIPHQVLKARLPIEPPKGEAKFRSGTIDMLEQLVCGGKPKKLTCQVVGTSADTLYIDPLTTLSERAASLLESEGLLVSTLKLVYVSHIDIPLTLFVQENTKLVAWVQEQLETPQERLAEVAVGQICAAEFDGRMYRAEVIDIKCVRFIDYGNVENASTWWRLTPEVAAVPPLCKMCYLKGSDDLSPAVNTALEDLVDFEKQYVAVLEGEDEILLFVDGEDLVDIAKKSVEINNNGKLQMKQETEEEKEKEALAETPEPCDVGEKKEEQDENAICIQAIKEEIIENDKHPEPLTEIKAPDKAQQVEEVEPGASAPVDAVAIAQTHEPTDLLESSIKESIPAPKELEDDDQQEQEAEESQAPAAKPEFRQYLVSSFTSTLEFYLQPDPNAVEALSKELSQQPDFPLADLTQNEMCAALSDHDGKWGRAQILSLRPPLGYFFDTGKKSQIRSFKLLSKQQSNIDLLATRCELKDSLTDVVFKEGQWIEAKIEEDGKVELKNEHHWRKAVITHYESHCEFYVRAAEDDLR